MTTITLPPINIGTAVIPSTAGLRLVADIDIRARDLEVARLVLEGAAQALRNKQYMNAVDYVRALEAKHHE